MHQRTKTPGRLAKGGGCIACRRRSARFRRSLSLLRATLDSTADGLLVVDREGRITIYNRTFAEMWHLPESITTTRDDQQALAVARALLVDPDAFAARVADLYAHPGVESRDVLSLADGRTIERYSQPQRLGSRCVGRVWSFRDVTVQRRVEGERDRRLREAQEAVRARDDFFAAASHELKTPITSLELAVQQLARTARSRDGGVVPPAQLAWAISMVERQAKRLDALLDALLDVSRIEAGRVDLDRVEVDLVDLVRSITEGVGGCQLVTPAGGPVRGSWDRARLEQIARVLVGNALKYGGGKPIEITVAAAGDRAQLVVRDHGIGVPPESQARIFERFERASSPLHYGGLGLGLFVARRLAEAHGGTLVLRSEPGEGAVFTLELPRSRP